MLLLVSSTCTTWAGQGDQRLDQFSTSTQDVGDPGEHRADLASPGEQDYFARVQQARSLRSWSQRRIEGRVDVSVEGFRIDHRQPAPPREQRRRRERRPRHGVQLGDRHTGTGHRHGVATSYPVHDFSTMTPKLADGHLMVTSLINAVNHV